MKAELLVEMEVIESQAPDWLAAQCVRRDGRMFAPVGTVYHSPDCFWFVRMGKGKALDEECARAAGQTPEQHEAAVYAAGRLSAGIAKEDFELYDRGYIVGYNADGSYKPGPNWAEYEKTVKPAADSEDDI